jgi:hypothetical protein
VYTYTERGRGMARPKKETNKKYIRQNISMDPEQLKRVTAYCQKEDRAISWVIRQALDRYLNDNVA